ncbi:MAG: SpoIIE family protein phosphatase [Clostridia bacterium]|nr:SpoIIE family protein phosphatase [Clostridia bacterium]
MGNENQRNGASSSFAEELHRRWGRFTDRVFGGMTVKERFLMLVAYALTAVIAYMATTVQLPVPGADALKSLSFPLGDALLCASGRTAPAAYAALMYSAYKAGDGFVLRAALLTGVLLLRMLAGIWLGGADNRYGRMFRETLSMKLGSATALSLICCGIYSLNNPLTPSTLPGALAALLLTPAITAGIGGFFSGYPSVDRGKRDTYLKLGYELSTCFFFALCVYASSGFVFTGCSLSALIALFLTVITGSRGGMLRGGAIGLILGAIFDPAYAPSLAVTGIFSGALSGTGIATAVGLSCAAGCGVALFTRGSGAIVNWIPENVIAAAITAPVIRYEFLPHAFPFPKRGAAEPEPDIQNELDRERGRIGVQRLYGISDAFSSLSAAQKRRSDGTRENTVPDAKEVCRRLCVGFCDSCPLVAICWENREEKTANAIKTAVWQLYNPTRAAGNAAPDELPNGFKCLRPEALKKELIRICESPDFRSRTPENTVNNGFSEEYRCVSEMIRHIADASEDEVEADNEATEKAKRAARRLSFTTDAISVFGKRIKTVVAYGIDSRSADSVATDKLRSAFSEACGAPLAAPVICGGEKPKMIFESARTFDTECSCRQQQAPSEDCNGDTSVSFSTENGYYYSLICDGMGSGREAAESSGIAASLAEKLLRCQISPELAVRMIGSTLRRIGNECFTTLDLFCVDLMNGKGMLLKSGAASSYVMREGDVRCISIPSLPLGITSESSAERIKFNLRDGDTVVLISDGIAQDGDDGAWLTDFLKDNCDLSAEELSDAILASASERRGRALSADDMTVSVIRIRRIIAPLSAAS